MASTPLIIVAKTMNLRQPLRWAGQPSPIIFWTVNSSGALALNNSYAARVKGAAAVAGTWNKFRLQLSGGVNGTNGGWPVPKMVLIRTLSGSTAVVDSVQVTQGGSTTITAPSGFQQNGNFALPSPVFTDFNLDHIDTLHDYYIVWYSGSTSPGSNNEVGTRNVNASDTFNFAVSLTGDQTGAADMSIFSFPANGTLTTGILVSGFQFTT